MINPFEMDCWDFKARNWLYKGKIYRIHHDTPIFGGSTDGFPSNFP